MNSKLFKGASVVLAGLLLGVSIGRAQVAGSMGMWPQNSAVVTNGTVQFGAYVPISPNSVKWFVNGIVGGNAGIGSITTNGLYLAPLVAPATNVLTIKVQSAAFPTSFTSTSVTVTRAYPYLWSVSPASLQVGNYQISLNGANFTPDAVVQANGQDLPTTYLGPTSLEATGAAAGVGSILFAVRVPGPGPVTGNTVSAKVGIPVITVAVSPATATVPLGNSKAFSASVAGAVNTAVTWSVVGGAVNGTVTAGGIFTGPAVMPASPTVKARATSVANTSVFGDATITLTQPPAVNLSVNPPAATVVLGANRTFTATVTGNTNTAVTWSVPGGAPNGKITPGGVYTAPAALPNPPTITILATSVANALVSAPATITLTPPPVLVTVSPAAATVQIGGTKQFSANVSNSTNSAVTWSVLGGAANGTINPAGAYVTPATLPASPTVTVRATSVADATATADATLTLIPAPDYSALLTAARIAEQTSFGPNDASLAEIQQLGLNAYLARQFSLPATPIPAPADNSVGSLQQWQLHTFTTAPDQLRQRVIYALSQIIVVSADKNIYADAMLPWMNTLSQHAFGNYRDLLRDITKCPSMGKYLDLANSTKPGAGGGANENYPRESMQLFSLGLWLLNMDGSPALDTNNAPIPTYTQVDVAALARALTGWVYAEPPGGPVFERMGAPMVSAPQNHDFTAKVVLGQTIPAGQSVEADLESYLDILMAHPNIAPFIATRLIRSLVTSNPSPGYIQRVAQVFKSAGGDLQATVTAVLTDAEARNDTPAVNSGRLKDSIQHTCGLLRALNGSYNNPNGVVYLYGYMAQSPLDAPSVFSWFSPLYHVPYSPIFGPEFQIYTPTEATLRDNLFFSFLSTPNSTDFSVDLSPFQPFGNDMPGLVEMANQKLLYGRMPAAMKQVLIDAATPGYDATTRIQTVLYLTALSGQYAIQQ
jgi:uncharacterized protein (DUF1800 family)